MRHILTLAFAGLLVTVLPASVAAQASIGTELGFLIPTYSSVTGGESGTTFFTDSADGASEAAESIVYETNGTGKTVYVHVDGDLTGLELRVEPDLSSSVVLGMAQSGTPGGFVPVAFSEAGSSPLVTDITGAGVALDVRYSLVPTSAAAAGRMHEIRIYYSID